MKEIIQVVNNHIKDVDISGSQLGTILNKELKDIDSRIDKQFDQIENDLRDIRNMLNQIENSKIGKKILMRDDVIYNKHDNMVMVKTDCDLIYIICNKKEQQDNVVKRMTTDNCLLESYEEWDEGEDKMILTFRVLDNYEIKPELN